MSWMSTEIVSGIVTGFMHKEVLHPGEKRCLENNLAAFIGSLVGVIRDTIKAIKAFVNPGIPAGLTPQQASTAEAKTKQASLMSNGMDAVVKIGSLVTSATTLGQGCVKGDALEMLNRTAHHFIDPQFLANRFLASAVDLPHFLADAIVTFERKDYQGFGEDIGRTLRKVLLSNSTLHSSLPEGVPEEKVIRETAEGLLSGFFGNGAWLEITDAARPDVDLRLDLHSCIAYNRPFFKEIWLALWNVFAQLSLNLKQHKFSITAAKGGSHRWTGDLMVALMQLPTVLARCNINKDTESMLGEALQTLGQLQVHMGLPVGSTKKKDLAETIALSVSAWTHWDFRTFGKALGELLREFLIRLFPQKYTVDDSGRLRRKLERSSLSRLSQSSGWALPIAFAATVVLVVTGILRGIAGVRRGMNVVSNPIDAELAANVADDCELE